TNSGANGLEIVNNADILSIVNNGADGLEIVNNGAVGFSFSDNSDDAVVFDTNGGTLTFTSDVSVNFASSDGTDGTVGNILPTTIRYEYLSSDTNAENHWINVSQTGIEFETSASAGYGDVISMHSSGISITLDGTNILAYTADYSANYTDRSLVDK